MVQRPVPGRRSRQLELWSASSLMVSDFHFFLFLFFIFCSEVHVEMIITATPSRHPATCWTSFSKRTPAQPPRAPWGRDPTAAAPRPAGHLRAGRQPVEPQPVGFQTVAQVRTCQPFFKSKINSPVK